jgi:hypothetical protein
VLSFNRKSADAGEQLLGLLDERVALDAAAAKVSSAIEVAR